MKDENPPAFPQPLAAEGPFGGMGLRDWFAGQALAGMSAHKDSSKWEMHEITADAYAYADAMIAARKGGSND